jgi:hypothetical protein
VLDLYNRVAPTAALTPRAAIATNTTTNGTAVDLSALDNGANGVVFFVEAGTITDGTFVFKIQDSPDNTNWTDVAAPYLQAPASLTWTSATTSGTCLKIGYLGNANGGARYVRLVVTSTGTTSGGFMTAIAVLSLLGVYPA